MGKEAKIGIGVIFALLSVFGVLLFRHFMDNAPPPIAAREKVAAQPLTNEGMGGRANVVAQQAQETGLNRTVWGERGTTSPDDQASAAPPASYMPEEAPANQLADQEPAPVGDEIPPARPLAASPFQRRSADTHTGDLPEAAANLEAQSETLASQKNPLRRLSAEEPIEDPVAQPEFTVPNEAQAPSEIPAADLPAEEPAAELPNEDPRPARRGAPAFSDAALDEVPPAAIEEAPAEVPLAQEPATEEPAQPEVAQPEVSAEPAPRRRTAQPRSGWQASEPAAGAARELPPREPAPIQRVTVENGRYQVQPNDSLWTVSEKVYGTGGYFKAIAAHNRATLPRSDQLSVGSELLVPPASELEQKYPSLCPKQRKSALVSPRSPNVQASGVEPSGSQVTRSQAIERRSGGNNVYVVNEGDTLFDIARYELGKASRWAEIYALNREVLGEDFDYLQPGVELTMPERGAEADTIGSRDGRSQR